MTVLVFVGGSVLIEEALIISERTVVNASWLSCVIEICPGVEVKIMSRHSIININAIRFTVFEFGSNDAEYLSCGTFMSTVFWRTDVVSPGLVGSGVFRRG